MSFTYSALRLSSSGVLQYLIGQIIVRQKHASATIPLDSELVQNLCRIFAVGDSLLVILPLVSYDRAAGKTSNWEKRRASPI